jgi:DNA adenine methylase
MLAALNMTSAAVAPPSAARLRAVRQQLGFDFHACPRPFVKWVGGKGAILGQLLPLLPTDIAERRYFEPFAGGAALFFRLRPQRAVLGDINAQLMATYRCVQSSAQPLLEQLCVLESAHNPARYYLERAAYNESAQNMASVMRCARFIYLNKTCYNGLQRVNRRGEFNVPVGRYRAPRVADANGLRAAQRVLQDVSLRAGTFETVLEDACRGDFVYFDPPYDVEPGAKGFTAYAASAFGPAQQDVLAELFHVLDRRGCKLMLSNSYTAANRMRYARFHVSEVKAPRAINCKAAGRGAVRELVVRNY